MTHPVGTPNDAYVWICTYCGKTFDAYPFETVCAPHVLTWAKSQIARRGDKIVGLKLPKNTQFRRDDG